MGLRKLQRITARRVTNCFRCYAKIPEGEAYYLETDQGGYFRGAKRFCYRCFEEEGQHLLAMNFGPGPKLRRRKGGFYDSADQKQLDF